MLSTAWHFIVCSSKENWLKGMAFTIDLHLEFLVSLKQKMKLRRSGWYKESKCTESCLSISISWFHHEWTLPVSTINHLRRFTHYHKLKLPLSCRVLQKWFYFSCSQKLKLSVDWQPEQIKFSLYPPSFQQACTLLPCFFTQGLSYKEHAAW